MKKMIPLIVWVFIASTNIQSQVTQINSNKSLQVTHLLTGTKAILVSGIDQHLWVTDGTLAGTIELSTVISFVNSVGSVAYLDGKFIFAGTAAATGTELYITDGTPAGTILLSDINTGPNGSSPDGDAAVLNGFLYFTADRPAEGRELWRTDGTPVGTTLVKDIISGPGGSNYPNEYHIFSTGTYLLFMARTPAPSLGVELWRSDGTDPGTVFLKDINPGPDSSGVLIFQRFNNLVLFGARDALRGKEIWKTDGTPGGTLILLDINNGPVDAWGIVPPLFFIFNNRAYFTANDGINGDEIWSTDGTEFSTSRLSNIGPGPLGSFDLLTDAVIVGNKFIFPSTDFFTRFQLWQSDGTTVGTTLFQDFSAGGEIPFILPSYTPNGTPALFQGNKFFFTAATATEGNELWISDGTVPNTQLVEDINSGLPYGVEPFTSFIYTSVGLYFAGDNGINGNELWKSDGTAPNTSLVADIITGADSSNPELFSILVNGKILFTATNGDDPIATDLYAVDGTFSPVPIKLGNFSVVARGEDAILHWETLQESNSRDFTIQRSFDGVHFDNIGSVAAIGTSATGHGYTFSDAGILNNGKSVFYYRLLSADMDGKTALSNIVSLKIKGQSWDVRLLNNPVTDNINLAVTGIKNDVEVSINTATGRTIRTNKFQNVNSQMSIPATDLAHGFYVLIVSNGNDQKIIRFIK